MTMILVLAQYYKDKTQRNFGNLEGHFKQIYDALERAKSI